MRILILDRDPISRTRTARLLAHPSITIITASTCGEARRALFCQYPQLAVFDENLPDGCGLDLLSLARRIGTRVIIMNSMLNDYAFMATALRLGASDVLPKPCNPCDLVHAIWQGNAMDWRTALGQYATAPIRGALLL